MQYLELIMKSVLLTLVALGIASAQLAAVCKASDQPGRVVKVIEQDVASKPTAGPQAPLPEGSESSGSFRAGSVRTAIFSFGKKRYSLLMFAADREPRLMPGEPVCLREEHGEARIATEQGIILPGIAKLVPAIPMICIGRRSPAVPATPPCVRVRTRRFGELS